MKKLVLAALLCLFSVAMAEEIPIQFARSLTGRMVRVSFGEGIHTTFAGKLGFRDRYSSWQSVCANVRAPVGAGQIYGARILDSSKCAPGIAKAGRIVAAHFYQAQTPEQCAGLQLAVWEAIEDSGDAPDFFSGAFQAQAEPAVLAYAYAYYETPREGGSTYLQATGGGQSQLSPPPITTTT